MTKHHDLLRSFKDNCGFGLVANIKNKASHKVLDDAITALERMMHRGAVAADGKLVMEVDYYFQCQQSLCLQKHKKRE